jgi:hypothetical protein
MENFKIGDYIIIIKKPDIWLSSLSYACPFIKEFKYPYKCQIKNILYVTDPEHIAMTDGYFGWSLSHLIKNKLIIKDEVKYRKLKIEKLNESR